MNPLNLRKVADKSGNNGDDDDGGGDNTGGGNYSGADIASVLTKGFISET